MRDNDDAYDARSAAGYAIRDCGPRDYATVADIYNESIRARDATMDLSEKSEGDIRALVEGFHEREALLVLEVEGVLVGWGIVKRYSDRLGYRTACETSVYLRRDARGRGLGTLLKRAVIERCRRLGYHHLVAKVWAANETSIAYNRKLGYEVVGVQREIGFVDGRWQDVVIMQLILDDVPPYAPEIG